MIILVTIFGNLLSTVQTSMKTVIMKLLNKLTNNKNQPTKQLNEIRKKKLQFPQGQRIMYYFSFNMIREEIVFGEILRRKQRHRVVPH